MKFVLCFFAVILPLAIYPAIFTISPELSSFWGNCEVDIVNWYRSLLIATVGIPTILFLRKDYALILYAVLLFLSYALTQYPDTAFFGSPDRHEGLYTILGYIGIYLLAARCGITKAIEKSLSIVVYTVFAVCVMQMLCGNFLYCQPFSWLMPKLPYEAVRWPLFGLMGNPNHLGLFCALFLPYVIIKKKYLEIVFILVMLVGSESRGAWISAFVTTLIISRRYLLYLLIACVIVAIPMRERIIFKFKDSLSQIHYPLRDGDLDNRIYMWRAAVPALRKDTLIGDGPSTFALFVPQFEWFPHAIIDRPHNVFINTWQNTGLLSLLTLSWIVVKDLLLGKNKALKMGVVGFLLAGFFTDSVLCVTPYFLMFLGGLKNEYTKKR